MTTTLNDNIKIIIVDDEPLARLRIKNLIKEVSGIDIIGEFSNGAEAIKGLIELQPDIVFLDIKMQDMNGFDVLNNIPEERKPLVIFISAFDDYALKAFDNFAFDYLLKPFKDERFFKSLSRAIEHLKLKTSNDDNKLDILLSHFNNIIGKNNGNKLNSIPIRLGNKISFINTDNIRYILAAGYYAEIHTENKQHLVRDSLTNLILELDEDKFIRIHRSSIINIGFIQEIINSNYGEVDIKMKDNKVLRISKSYKKALFLKLKIQ